MSSEPEGHDARLRAVPWHDAVVERLGFPPSHPYVEYCWAPILGPSATLMWRRLAGAVAAEPQGIEVDLRRLGADLGIPSAGGRWRRAEAALERLCRYGLARWHGPDTLALRTSVPPLSSRRLLRATETSVAAHRRFTATRDAADNPLLAAALSYAARGWAVFPLRPRAKEPDGRLARHGLRDATCDPERIRRWWEDSPQANVGLRTGDAVDVVDIDGPRSILESSGPVPLVRGGVVSTGRGWHLYMATAGLPTRAAVLPGVDLRGVGGYVVAPPSLHPSGHRYRFVDPASGAGLDGPRDGPLPPVPAWVVELCQPKPPASPEATAPPRRLHAGAYARAALEGECAAVAGTPEGARNDRLNRAAFAAGTLVGAGVLDDHQATEHLLAAAHAAGLPDVEARRTISSGLGAGRAHPRGLEADNAPSASIPGRAGAAVVNEATPDPPARSAGAPARLAHRSFRR